MGPIRSPNGLDLVTFKREADFVLVHHHKAGEGHGKVVAQATFGQCRGEGFVSLGLNIRRLDAFEVFTIVQDFEQEAIPLLTVFAGKGAEVLHRRGLNGQVAVFDKHRTDGIEDIVAFEYLIGGEIPGTFGGSWFHFLVVVETHGCASHYFATHLAERRTAVRLYTR